MRMNDTAPLPYHKFPDEYYETSGLSLKRFQEDMDMVIDCREEYLIPILKILNELPENPVLEAIKRQIDAVILSPHQRARNPTALFREMMQLQYYACAYLETHGTKGKKAKPVISEGIEDLKEIDPENKTQQRAMRLLRQLKLNPDKALHTEACKTLLESSEGAALDSKGVRRAMEYLAETYGPKILYEMVDGSNRLRINV